MKIGIVTTWFERGAAYVSRQFMALLEEDHEVFIYARAGEHYAIGDPLWDTENVTWGKKVFKASQTRVDLREFGQWIEKLGIEVILFNEQQWFPVLVMARSKGIKIGAYVDFYKRDTIKHFKLYDFLICNTKRHYSVFDWHPQAYYVPWGTDTNLFLPSEPLKAEAELKFFFSGGMDPVYRKGGNLLIRAFYQLRGEPAQLIIHSQVPLEPLLHDEERQMFSVLIESGKLKLIIETVHAPGLYHLGDVYVYPTHLEGIGLSIIEALSCGLPVIVPDNGPMNEFVAPSTGSTIDIAHYFGHENGYYWGLCEVEVDDLAKKMKWYIDHRDQVPQMQESARASAVKERHWPDRKEEINRIFTETSVQNLDLSDLNPAELKDEFSRIELIRKIRQDVTRIFVKGPSKFWHVS